MGDYWVIVDKVAIEPRAFILLPSEVKQLAKYNEKNGKRTYWLNPTEYDQENFVVPGHVSGLVQLMPNKAKHNRQMQKRHLAGQPTLRYASAACVGGVKWIM